MTNSDIKAVYLGETEVSSLMLGGIELWSKGEQIEIIDSYFITATLGLSSYQNTTERDQTVVVVQTNIDKKIEGVTASATNGNSYLIVQSPLYFGNGTYVTIAAVADYYGGYGFSGLGCDDITITVPGAESPLFIKKSYRDIPTDHTPNPRTEIQGDGSFCWIKMIPYEGFNYPWRINGFAFDAQELSYNETTCDEYRYSKTAQKILYQKYELQSVTTFPKNTPSLATAQFGSVARGDTNINISVGQNNTLYPRLGYVEMIWSRNSDYNNNVSELNTTGLIPRNIILQDGPTQKIGYNGSISNGALLIDKNSRFLMIDLDDLEISDFSSVININKLDLYFLDITLADKIELYLDGVLVNPTQVQATILNSALIKYRLSTGEHTITIKKKSS